MQKDEGVPADDEMGPPVFQKAGERELDAVSRRPINCRLVIRELTAKEANVLI